MRFAFVAIAAIFFARAARAADAKEKTCAQLQKQYVGMSGAWNLDKAHKVFGQPSRIDRASYKDSIRQTSNDLLVFDFPGCYFFLYVDREGRVLSTHEFHFRQSELQGDVAALAAQRADAGALYRAASTGDKAALQQLRALAEKGGAQAQYNLGVMYLMGEGVPKDAVQAAQWNRRAADRGYARAQYNLGAMYANGEGVPKDAVQAAQWYSKAADQGDAQAQYYLGLRYSNGEGVSKDAAQGWCPNLTFPSGCSGIERAPYPFRKLLFFGAGGRRDASNFLCTETHWYNPALGFALR
jgi:TPR repeat protein